MPGWVPVVGNARQCAATGNDHQACLAGDHDLRLGPAGGDGGADGVDQLVERSVVGVLLDLDIGGKAELAQDGDDLFEGGQALLGKSGIARMGSHLKIKSVRALSHELISQFLPLQCRRLHHTRPHQCPQP